MSVFGEGLRRRRRKLRLSLAALGLRGLDAEVTVRSTLREAIDSEFYRRSVAHYERNFKASFSA